MANLQYVKLDHIVDYSSITDETHWAVYYPSIDSTLLIRRTLPMESIMLKHLYGTAQIFTSPSTTLEIDYCDEISTTAEVEYQYGRYKMTGDSRYKTARLTDHLGPRPFDLNPR